MRNDHSVWSAQQIHLVINNHAPNQSCRHGLQILTVLSLHERMCVIQFVFNTSWTYLDPVNMQVSLVAMLLMELLWPVTSPENTISHHVYMHQQWTAWEHAPTQCVLRGRARG